MKPFAIIALTGAFFSASTAVAKEILDLNAYLRVGIGRTTNTVSIVKIDKYANLNLNKSNRQTTSFAAGVLSGPFALELEDVRFRNALTSLDGHLYSPWNMDISSSLDGKFNKSSSVCSLILIIREPPSR